MKHLIKPTTAIILLSLFFNLLYIFLGIFKIKDDSILFFVLQCLLSNVGFIIIYNKIKIAYKDNTIRDKEDL